MTFQETMLAKAIHGAIGAELRHLDQVQQFRLLGALEEPFRDLLPVYKELFLRVGVAGAQALAKAHEKEAER